MIWTCPNPDCKYKGTEKKGQTPHNIARNHCDSLVCPLIETGEIVQDFMSDEEQSVLRGFRGDIGWVHQLEGHVGRPYWPGGNSGITLDPGCDLGYVDFRLFEVAYKMLIEESVPGKVFGSRLDYSSIDAALGLRGVKAKDRLFSDEVLQSIRISRDEASSIFPIIANSYWKGIVERFPSLMNSDVPNSVHTVMLSLAYNRGFGNKGLQVLDEYIKFGYWLNVGYCINFMQQDHKLKGIRIRRRKEANLIFGELSKEEKS